MAREARGTLSAHAPSQSKENPDATADEAVDDMSRLIVDAMAHPDAGKRLLFMIVLTHASVNGGDPAWDPDFAIHEARTTLEHGDT